MTTAAAEFNNLHQFLTLMCSAVAHAEPHSGFRWRQRLYIIHIVPGNSWGLGGLIRHWHLPHDWLWQPQAGWVGRGQHWRQGRLWNHHAACTLHDRRGAEEEPTAELRHDHASVGKVISPISALQVGNNGSDDERASGYQPRPLRVGMSSVNSSSSAPQLAASNDGDEEVRAAHSLGFVELNTGALHVVFGRAGIHSLRSMN